MFHGTWDDSQGLTYLCGHSEVGKGLGQYDSFELVWCSENGIIQIWRCLTCGQKFRLTL